MGRIINLAKAESPGSTISKDRAEVHVGLGRNPRRIEIGFGRLFFRRGRGWNASFRHIEVWSVLQPPKTQPLTFEVPLKPCAGLVRGDGYLHGAILAPAAKRACPMICKLFLRLLISEALKFINIKQELDTPRLR